MHPSPFFLSFLLLCVSQLLYSLASLKILLFLEGLFPNLSGGCCEEPLDPELGAFLRSEFDWEENDSQVCFLNMVGYSLVGCLFLPPTLWDHSSLQIQLAEGLYLPGGIREFCWVLFHQLTLISTAGTLAAILTFWTLFLGWGIHPSMLWVWEKIMKTFWTQSFMMYFLQRLTGTKPGLVDRPQNTEDNGS